MDVSGIVRDGVVVLEEGVSLPEGTKVVVHVNGTRAATRDPLDFSDLAAEMGPADLATNLDHYLYNHPKQSND
jgi:hypothetical protein